MERKEVMKRIGKKISVFLVSLFVLSFVTFAIARLAPGDPLVSYYGERVEKMSETQKAAARKRLGVDEPLLVQYGRWLERAVHGDFGLSFQYKQPAGDVLAARIGNTLLLGGAAYIVLFLASLLIGVGCALHEGTWLDRVLVKAGTVSACVPEFWLCLLLIFVFSVTLGWLPASGAYTIGRQSDVLDRLAHLVLPLAVLVISHVWYYAALVRNRLLEELGKDYVLLGQANGLSLGRIVWRHGVPNVLPSYLSLMAIALPHILGGTYVVEMVFSYPGLGALAYESARYHDYNVLMLTVLLSGTVVLMANGLVNALAHRLDPTQDDTQILRESEGEWL
ncbi:ABC transporter permease [Dubosiella muris]|uniref:ABC transporter permease n=1 Tax=Dubosiella muris TaxID=3038133 RepID=A0AC61R4V9_9FIRM|nr:ABC transporter permease [Dubosiella muris]